VFVVSPKVSMTGFLWLVYVVFTNIYGIVVLLRVWKNDGGSIYKGKIKVIIIAALFYSVLPVLWGIAFLSGAAFLVMYHYDYMTLGVLKFVYLSLLSLSFIIFCILLIFGMRKYWFLKQKEYEISELARVGKYTANILHDLKNLPLLPKLASIKSALMRATEHSDCDTLVRSRDDILNILETLPEHERNLQAMLNVRLAAFSKLDGFDYTAASEININHIVRHEMQKMVGPYIERYGIAYLINDAADYFIQGDADLICSAIFNLIKNSVDAISERKIEQGYINITVGEIKNDLAIDVCDNGGGMPEGTAKKIFHEKITTKTRGTGIGLHHAMTIINAHGGRIELIKTDQTETVFRITLPIARKSTYSEE
jgi:signal transduction histidine kinase